MKSDIEIAREVSLRKIKEIATGLGIPREEVQNYGRYIAKIPIHLIDEEKIRQHNLILVTAITPTKAGIGKTTVSIGLALGLNKIGKKAVVALREPSLGPCFGMKGGAAFQVFDVRCQAKDRHDFRSGCDVKTCLRRYTVGRSAQAGNNVAQAAVIHVQYAFPFDFFQTFTGITRLVDVIVQQCRDHIVGRSNRMEIPRKMQVDVFHRQHLRVSASGSSAFHAEARAQ